MKKLLLTLFLTMLILAGILLLPIKKEREQLSAGIHVLNTTSNLTFPEPRRQRPSFLPEDVNNESGFNSSWALMAEGGYIDGQFNYENKHLDVYMDSQGIESCYLYHEGISLEQGTNYALYFNISSNIQRNINVALKDTGSWQTIASSDFSINENPQDLSLSFTMNAPTTYQAALYFYIGNEGTHESEYYHVIDLSSIRLVNTSGSKNTIRVNQAGYFLEEEKHCVFPYNQGDVFDVVNANDNTVVYSGPIVNSQNSMYSNENTYLGNFSNLLSPGTYYIRSQFSETSYPFTISDGNNYLSTINQLLKMISLQRCGMPLEDWWASNLSHNACHQQNAIIYGTEEVREVNGGWHDAGDYGRYVTTGAKTVLDLLNSYQVNRHIYNDATGSPDSNNGIPDILDEARYELEWLFKMQGDYGGVYSKVMTQQFPGSILPENDTAPLYLMEPDTLATADFSAAMALASIVYKDKDNDFSNRCLEASKNAFNYLLGNQQLIFHDNPEGFSGGDYRDNNDLDERINAALLLYTATLDRSYLSYAEEYFNQDPNCIGDLSWKSMAAYGIYNYLQTEENSDFYNNLRKSFLSSIDALTGFCYADNYQAAIDSYDWGSNAYAANRGILFMMAYELTQDPNYRRLGMEQVSYLFGKNALNMSFISSTGTVSPVNVHSRIAYSKGTTLPGALVGGPNSSREDDVTEKMPEDTPQAKVYADNYGSYSTNEIAIYWNSALIHLLTYFY